MELVLAACSGRVDDQGDGGLLGDAPVRLIPRERPYPIWASGVFDAGDSHARDRQPVHEPGRASTHLPVADGDELRGLGPHLGRLAAPAVGCTPRPHERRGAGGAVVRDQGVQAEVDDLPEGVGVAPDAGGASASRVPRASTHARELQSSGVQEGSWSAVPADGRPPSHRRRREDFTRLGTRRVAGCVRREPR